MSRQEDKAPEKREPCPTCPWRRETPPRGFPGGFVAADSLMRMVRNEDFKVMQCHCSPDTNPSVCVGFAVQVGGRSIAYRLLVLSGEPQLSTDADLLSLPELIQKHGGTPTNERRRSKTMTYDFSILDPEVW